MSLKGYQLSQGIKTSAPKLKVILYEGNNVTVYLRSVFNYMGKCQALFFSSETIPEGDHT